MRRLFLYRNILWKYSTTQIKKKKRASICTLTEITSKCGDGEIRTRDTVSRIHTFQACSFNHSDTSPLTILLSNELSAFKPHFLLCNWDTPTTSRTDIKIVAGGKCTLLIPKTKSFYHLFHFHASGAFDQKLMVCEILILEPCCCFD